MGWICISSFLIALVSAAVVFAYESEDVVGLLGDGTFLLATVTFLTTLVLLLARRVHATLGRSSDSAQSSRSH